MGASPRVMGVGGLWKGGSPWIVWIELISKMGKGYSEV